MVYHKTVITGLVALAFGVSTAAAAAECYTIFSRTTPAHGSPNTKDHICADQITVCSALCGDKGALSNRCISNNGGSDNPFDTHTYCFECVCANGQTPDLDKYRDTVPNNYCQRWYENCIYGYNQVGRVMPEGACERCGEEQATKGYYWPSTMPWSLSTTYFLTTTRSYSTTTTITDDDFVEYIPTASSSRREVTTTSTDSTSPTSEVESGGPVASTSTNESVTRGSSSIVTSTTASRMTPPPRNTAATISSIAAASSSTSTNTAAAAGGELFKPAMGVIGVMGMAMAVVMVL
ncbi:hypothetical protein B0H63DRAFT_468951 [Podospora didyma]|uniref:DUF7707 domain-containing protein n=1 Tax=Podospora didyma TaxID=330526 RepID=A0AAE0NSQ6_9PEZI|nr:hypothetical protein B0H63DRAFT_468951 [Podospora didyma]